MKVRHKRFHGVETAIWGSKLQGSSSLESGMFLSGPQSYLHLSAQKQGVAESHFEIKTVTGGLKWAQVEGLSKSLALGFCGLLTGGQHSQRV